VTEKKPASRKKSTAAARFIVLTGLSGAGKSQAIRALEDLGYYCVDNLPVSLLPVMAELAERQTEHNRVAVVMDIREPRFVSDFPRVYRKLRTNKHLSSRLIFLEAGQAELVRRFSETRRPHPLAPEEPISDAIALERRKMRRVRAMADEIVDTSDLTVHELRQIFLSLSRDRKTRATLVLTFESFGFKHGLPLGADLVFDVRFRPNPHFVPTLRSQTGRDQPVADFLERQPATGQLLTRLTSLLKFLVPHYVAEGKSYLTVAIGCTGGRHRSVYVAEALRRALAGTKGVTARVRHRDAGREKAAS
jgi:UPF0042 nucleotide-binding protein